MSVSTPDAIANSDALRAAGAAVTIRQLRYELLARAEEWERAAEFLADHDEGEAVIEMFGAVTAGMRVAHDRFGFTRVIRKIDRGDQLSLHVESPESGAGYYINLMHQTSPVVVRQ